MISSMLLTYPYVFPIPQPLPLNVLIQIPTPQKIRHFYSLLPYNGTKVGFPNIYMQSMYREVIIGIVSYSDSIMKGLIM